MPPRHTASLLGLLLTGLAAAADESTPAAPADTGVSHEAVKDIKYAPIPGFTDSTSVNVSAAPIIEPTPPPPPQVVLSPYIVRELPHRTYRDLNEALAQHRRLDDHAFYKKGNFEMLLPPAFEVYNPPGNAHLGPIPRLKLVLLKYTW